MSCPKCQQPFQWHVLNGQEIDWLQWHMVFTSEGVAIFPSDFFIPADQSLERRIPQQQSAPAYRKAIYRDSTGRFKSKMVLDERYKPEIKSDHE